MEKQTLVKEICPTTAQGLIKNGALLVDVREKDEVAELSYDTPDNLNIPLSEFEERFSEIPKNQDVIVVCRDGNRSLRAAGFLINHGYLKVVNMEHGLNRWVQKGFPTKGNTASFQKNKHNTACCDTKASLFNSSTNSITNNTEPNKNKDSDESTGCCNNSSKC
jgi:rhodanese-related sulfurtransferase